MRTYVVNISLGYLSAMLLYMVIGSIEIFLQNIERLDNTLDWNTLFLLEQFATQLKFY